MDVPQFRPDTSFPYLAFATKHNLPYRDVLRIVDYVSHPESDSPLPNLEWPIGTYGALLTIVHKEYLRRRKSCEGKK